MSVDSNNKPAADDADVWAGRRKNNVRLAYLMGGIAIVIFLISLWKYRPL